MAESRTPSAPAALFRLEFGGASGWGHLVRSGVLAGALRSRGWRCDAWTAGRFESVPAELRETFDRVVPFAPGTAGVPAGYRWLVVDHYGTGDDELRAWRTAHAGRILAIDDEARRRLDAADLVLNTRPGLVVSPYAAGVATLLGERFALLRPGLWRPVAPAWRPPPHADPVLVTLGGTDPAGATEVVLEALADVDPAGFAPVVLRPGVSDPTERAARVLARFPASVWLDRVNAGELAGWAALCRFAVSAAGGTLCELAVLRLPFVAVVVAENQREFAAAIEARWHLPRVAAGPDLRAGVAAAVRGLLARAANDGAAIDGIDDRGADRVAEALGA